MIPVKIKLWRKPTEAVATDSQTIRDRLHSPPRQKRAEWERTILDLLILRLSWRNKCLRPLTRAPEEDNRQLKQPRRRRQRKRHLKCDFVLFQNVGEFSSNLILDDRVLVEKKRKETVVLCLRPPGNESRRNQAMTVKSVKTRAPGADLLFCLHQ